LIEMEPVRRILKLVAWVRSRTTGPATSPRSSSATRPVSTSWDAGAVGAVELPTVCSTVVRRVSCWAMPASMRFSDDASIGVPPPTPSAHAFGLYWSVTLIRLLAGR
jgi:hypothetical protein